MYFRIQNIIFCRIVTSKVGEQGTKAEIEMQVKAVIPQDWVMNAQGQNNF